MFKNFRNTSTADLTTECLQIEECWEANAAMGPWSPSEEELEHYNDLQEELTWRRSFRAGWGDFLAGKRDSMHEWGAEAFSAYEAGWKKAQQTF